MLQNVLVIGAAIADVCAKPYRELISGDSNPGSIGISAGGVGRNIAENLAHFGVSVDLITTVGNDYFGEFLVQHCKNSKIGSENILHDAQTATATYLAINNMAGDLELAVSDTTIIEKLSPDFFRSKSELISQYNTLVLDANLPIESLDYLIETFSHKTIFVDMVSETKALRLQNLMHNVFCIKPNLGEASLLTGINYTHDHHIYRMRDVLLEKGIKQACITLGKRGCFYFDDANNGFLKAKEIAPVNSSGAGDAFMAALIYGHLQGYNIRQCAKFALAASAITLMHPNAVNPHITVEAVKFEINNE